jgi:hypothetical protein
MPSILHTPLLHAVYWLPSSPLYLGSLALLSRTHHLAVTGNWASFLGLRDIGHKEGVNVRKHYIGLIFF